MLMHKYILFVTHCESFKPSQEISFVGLGTYFCVEFLPSTHKGD